AAVFCQQPGAQVRGQAAGGAGEQDGRADSHAATAAIEGNTETAAPRRTPGSIKSLPIGKANFPPRA
ncbi:MAG: hypothetical protein AB7G15_11150, partial [Alphaproteobacteria bacterium]